MGFGLGLDALNLKSQASAIPIKIQMNLENDHAPKSSKGKAFQLYPPEALPVRSDPGLIELNRIELNRIELN